MTSCLAPPDIPEAEKKQHTVVHKKVPLLFLLYLWQMWGDFNNSFTHAFTDKLRKKLE